MTVLVVEDDEDTRIMIAAILDSEGYEAACVSNGVEALRFMRSHDNVGLVLTDVMMPVIDGCVLVEMMRSDASLADIPIVMMTAAAPPRIPSDVTLLKKPFRLMELLDTLHAQYGRSAPASMKRPSSLPPSSDKPAPDSIARQA